MAKSIEKIVSLIGLDFVVKSVLAKWRRMRTTHDVEKLMLPSSLMKVVDVFNENPDIHLSKHNFEQYGITGIRQLIFRLKAMGATIDTTYQAKTNKAGKPYNGIASYKLEGWEK